MDESTFSHYKPINFRKMKKLSIILIMTLLANMFAMSQVNLQSGLMEYYPFEGNINDVSGNGVNGTPVNITYDQGIAGSCADFSLATSYVTSLGNNSDFKYLHDGSNFTVSIWLKEI